MKLLQRIKCMRCPRKADCNFMKALLRQYDEWWKSFEPGYRATLKRSDELLERLNN